MLQILVPISEYSRIYLGGTGGAVDLIFYGLILMIICIFRPNGLISFIPKRYFRKKETTMKILTVEKLSKSFGGIHANRDISFDVEEGSILGVIGPNGAGKSTLFDLITGFTKPDTGKVKFYDKNIFGISPDKISNLGVGRTFQKLKPFADQTLLENVMIGAFVKEKDIKRARDRALEIIDFVDLIEKRHHFAKELSTGQRKRLEMARAMAIDPKLLLMDEVTGGVDQKTIPGLVELVKKLKKTGVTIITIEHNINIIMEISDNVLALDQGKRIAFGEPKEIQNNKQVIDAYLGTFDAA